MSKPGSPLVSVIQRPSYRAGSLALAEYASAWQKSQLHRPTSVMQVDAHLRNHVMPFFGDRPIGSIRPSELQAWVRSRTEVLAPATSGSSTGSSPPSSTAPSTTA